jgi:hypothetical protein
MAKPVDIQSQHGKFTVKGYLKGYFNARTFVNVVQHLRDFERFHMNKRDLARWTSMRRSVFHLQKKKFFMKLKTSHEQVLGVLQINWKFLSL